MKPPEKERGHACKHGHQKLTDLIETSQAVSTSQLDSSPEPRVNPGDEKRPFGWYEKAARRLIREMFDATNNVATALEVYTALTEIASDKQSSTFTATHDYIGAKSGVNARTIRRILPTFAKLGLVARRQNYKNGIRGPITYTLLKVNKIPLGHNVLALGHGVFHASCPTSEESSEKSSEESTKESAVEREKKPNSKSDGQPNGKNDDVDCFFGECGKRLLRQIKELTKREGNSGELNRTWERRIKENPDAVQKAVIITERMVCQGKIKSTTVRPDNYTSYTLIY